MKKILKRKYRNQKSEERNFTEEIKSVYAKTSSSRGISVDKARTVVVCNELYQYNYLLFKEQQLNSVDVVQVSMDISSSKPIAKRTRSETNFKAPKTSNDYGINKYVLFVD